MVIFLSVNSTTTFGHFKFRQILDIQKKNISSEWLSGVGHMGLNWTLYK